MKWSIGLHIGENLLEVSAHNGDGWKEQRSFGVATALDQSLNRFLEEHQIQDIDKLQIVTNLPQRLFEKCHVSPCAILTTSGFETLLEMTVPVVNACYSVHLTRPRSPIEREYVFGVSERTEADGRVEIAVRPEEIEFLAAKLELSGVKSVAVCFLHSNSNNSNESVVRKILTEKGLDVYVSSELTAKDPARFWSAIMSASVMPLFKERVDALKAVFGERLKGEVKILGLGSIQREVPKTTLANISWEFLNHLAKRYALTSDLLFCGLERWLLIPSGGQHVDEWPSPYGPVAADHVQTFVSDVQPLSPIGKGFLSDAFLQRDAVGFDVGPVVFGRSLNPTLADLLIEKKYWPTLSGFTERTSERGLKRVEEALTTHAKALSDSSTTIDRNEFSAELMASAARSLNILINKHRQSQQLTLCGPTAPAVEALLRTTPLDWNMTLLGNEFFVTREIAKGDLN